MANSGESVPRIRETASVGTEQDVGESARDCEEENTCRNGLVGDDCLKTMELTWRRTMLALGRVSKGP